MAKKKQVKKKSSSDKKPKKAKSNVYNTLAVIVIIVALVALIALGVYTKGNIFPFPTTSTVVAEVNGQKITTEEVEKSYELFFFVSGYPASYQEMFTINDYLEQKIDEIILLQAAKKAGYSMTEEEIESSLDQLLELNNMDKDSLETELKSAGLSLDDMRNLVETQVISSRYINDTVLQSIEITDEDAESYYNENKNLFSAGENQVRVRHILVETEEEAEIIAKKARQGENFAELAKEYSIGPTSVTGGDLGVVSKGQMVEEFEKAAFALNLGEVSDPVETQFGWHVIKRDTAEIEFEDVKDKIKEALMVEKQSEAITAFIDDLKEKSEIRIIGDVKQSDDKKTPSVGSDCYKDYELTDDTVIFYHASWCPHCQNMKPIVEDLQEEGYSIHSAESDSETGTEVVQACFTDVLQGGIPQFICAGTKEYVMGEMSEAKLREFTDNCKK